MLTRETVYGATMEWGNPYTHEEHSRTTYTNGKCDWCGQERTRVYSYDGDTRHQFCNRDCAQCYQ